VDLELFPGADLGANAEPNGGCRAPIGRRDHGRGRSRIIRPQRPSTVAVLRELRRLIEVQHAEVLDEIERLKRYRRDDDESGPAILRHVVEIRRALGLTELHIPARHSRRRPMGR
jgi:hypothetical protein